MSIFFLPAFGKPLAFTSPASRLREAPSAKRLGAKECRSQGIYFGGVGGAPCFLAFRSPPRWTGRWMESFTSPKSGQLYDRSSGGWIGTWEQVPHRPHKFRCHG